MTLWKNAYGHCKKIIKSGETEADIVSRAKERFSILNKGKNFSFMHCHEILKNTPKFMHNASTDSDKKKKKKEV